ncbi:hypothetical protein FDP41_009607 [Naegleria fowleri]|uniref:Methyltransferase type 11 domain-containing protein n=1 Tax=Naegleria fowleri TaxID=5763 RepID=A0A6A5BAK3_NAEFO|nr:uncharacterized protein FDP41_009607 [Naegleria fowleri]KAF0971911.1 hypothetical protein FDP41_009607 [Naegleria fowleri]
MPTHRNSGSSSSHHHYSNRQGNTRYQHVSKGGYAGGGSGRFSDKNTVSSSSSSSYKRKSNDNSKYSYNSHHHTDNSDDHHKKRKQEKAPVKCTSVSHAFPRCNDKKIELSDLKSHLEDFIPEEAQYDLLEWILQVRDEYCPLLSYSEVSRSKNTLIDAYAGVGCASITFSRTSGFDNIVAVESSTERYNALKNNVVDEFQLEKYVEFVNANFLNWMKENYSDVKYFKSCIFIDLNLFALALPTSSDLSFESSLMELLKGLLEDFSCPLVVLRVKNAEERTVLDALSHVKTRKVIHNNNLQDGYDYVAVLPQLAVTTALNSEQQLTNKHGLPTVFSQKQFHYVWHQSKGDTKKRTEQILCKQMLRKCYGQQAIVKEQIQKFIETSSNDQEIYDKLNDLFQNKIFKSREYLKENPVNVTKMSTDRSTDTSYRTSNRSNKIKELIPKSLKVRNMLDIGCSEGSITQAVGHELGLTKENIHGCDVRDIGKTYTNDFTFHLISEQSNHLPFANNSFSLVTALMSFHHIKNVEETIKEVYRILEPGGALIIREHDCSPPETSLTLDIMHGLYSLVWSSPREMPNFCSEYFAEYRSSDEWTELITAPILVDQKDSEGSCQQTEKKQSGFILEYCEDLSTFDNALPKQQRFGRRDYKGGEQDIKNPFRSYHAVYIKRKD